MTSLYSDHVDKWKNCRKCELHKKRKRVVFARGTIPCRILFVGEAPGISEDVLGAPFVGPAGYLLNGIIREVVPTDMDYALCNLLGCIPLSDEGGKREPDDASIKACSPKIVDFIDIAKPELIVCVGKVSEHWLNPQMMGSVKISKEIPRISVVHPAAILRAVAAHQGLMRRQAIIAIRDGIEEHLNEQS